MIGPVFYAKITKNLEICVFFGEIFKKNPFHHEILLLAITTDTGYLEFTNRSVFHNKPIKKSLIILIHFHSILPFCTNPPSFD